MNRTLESRPGDPRPQARDQTSGGGGASFDCGAKYADQLRTSQGFGAWISRLEKSTPAWGALVMASTPRPTWPGSKSALNWLTA